MSTAPDDKNVVEQGELYDVQAMHAPIMRERAEPRDGYEPIHPIWSLIFGAFLFWGGWYLGRYSGEFRVDVLDEKKSLGGAAVESKPIDPLVLGERLYQGRCMACHQADGKGRPGQFPPLAGSEWVVGPPATLARIVLHGLQGKVTVAGESYNGQMPGLAAQMSDAQIAAVLTYVRQAWGNTAGPIDEAVVKAARQATTARKTPWTVAELEREPKEDALPASAPATPEPGKTAAPAPGPATESPKKN
ncbi:MAG: c-type cytochrome [Gemmataceae bacterium]|nr:c-type cytochrome [Gemmataceae bacterium]